jgi:hypothetical protein
VETAKHRLFQFLDVEILPDNMLVAVALDDAYQLGVLSSRTHIVWALALGGDLGGNTPRYNKTRCFDTFPFPDATPAQQVRIRELAETIDAHRKRQQAPAPRAHPHQPLQRGRTATRRPAPHAQRASHQPAGPGLRAAVPAQRPRCRRGPRPTAGPPPYPMPSY